jgi:ATP-dependent helicase/nuclease subunit A
VTTDRRLPFDDDDASLPAALDGPSLGIDGGSADADARRVAVDPRRNIVLEASAGTGKTRVLVERYVNLLRAGVDPDHILAITFTRKAAAEMRQRIVERLREASRQSAADAARWRDLRSRLGDIALSTIDAFCLRLLREFPLEADVDPAFELADDTDVLRFIDESLDGSLRICRALAKDEPDVALVFAQLGERRLRAGLAALLERRLVAPDVLRGFLAIGPAGLTAAVACRQAADRLCDLLHGVSGGLDAFLACGPIHHRQFALLAADIVAWCGPSVERSALEAESGQASFRAFVDRLRGYFLTQDGRPRGDRFMGTPFRADHCASPEAWRRHRAAAAALAPAVADAVRAFRRDLNVILSRGVWRVLAITLSQYRRALDSRARLDFSGVLERAVDLLRQMDEFASSRYRLESRYHHVLVDEFQDTSRAQWDLVALLVRSWGEGIGASSDTVPPSIFVVGDRKQSIYGFRDAEAALIEEAARFIADLRPHEETRRAISVSFRAEPPLLSFVNDLFGAVAVRENGAPRGHEFRFADHDRFPVAAPSDLHTPTGAEPEPCLGLVVGETVAAAAEAVGDEIARLLSGHAIRDRASGLRREARAADVAILFRSRESHREFEAALERRGIGTYVYKGLGFFEAEEVQDWVALLRYLADPTSHLRAAALLRSRLVRISDEGVRQLAPDLAGAILGSRPVPPNLSLEDVRTLGLLRASVEGWLALVDRITPAELLDHVMAATAYLIEIRGIRRLQARENLKKLRGLVRRIQNRGYATLSRITDHLDRLALGDESNAVIDAIDAVSLMTVHAAKGLEYPVVFLVNVGRGTGGARQAVRVGRTLGGTPAVSVADFQSEVDEDALARDREETKRLLYVATTRARDRLYLSATVQNGACRAGRGSLAEVMPKSLVELFGEAARSSAEVLPWRSDEGRDHQFLVRRDSAGRPPTIESGGSSPRLVEAGQPDDFAPWD